MAVVFGTVFKQNIREYAPYVLSGLLFWSIITDSMVAGWSVIVGNEPYIRQYNHPVIIYPLERSLASIISFLISTLALAVVQAICGSPINVLWGYATLPLTIVIYFIFEWSATIIAAYIGTKYRDYPQVISLVLQAVWYVSPVFFQESMFTGSPYLYYLFIFNPLTHMLKLIRNPFLEGKLPSLTNYLVSIAVAAVVALGAYWINKKNERDIIFYI